MAGSTVLPSMPLHRHGGRGLAGSADERLVHRRDVAGGHGVREATSGSKGSMVPMHSTRRPRRPGACRASPGAPRQENACSVPSVVCKMYASASPLQIAMSTRRIATIGFELTSTEFQSVDFRSKASLLDWDIVLFVPTIMGFYRNSDHYLGKPCFDERSSFQVRECCEHWRREIKQAIDTGKLVIVFLPELEDVYVDTGRRTHSGTGRNRTTTRHVDQFNNYEAIPTSLLPVTATGNVMKLAARGAEILGSYWSEFENDSQYKVVLANSSVPACIVTRDGHKTVGAIYQSKSSGALLLLPYIDFSPDRFATKGGQKAREAASRQFAERMLSAIVAIDKTVHSTGEVTPEPLWTTETQFALKPETALRVKLLEAERKVNQAQRHKEDLEQQLQSAAGLRALLYEKGKVLENVIIQALRILGFTATPYKDSNSEFDAVFESAEGRFIGEAEGKDNKAVNVDKLRQLSMNIHEDLQRDSVTAPAKPVLFGNGFRLLSLGERGEPFTDKCINAATTSSTALVFTPDLFRAVQYLVATEDAEYAQGCRRAIFSTSGRVVFPPPPEVQHTQDQIAVDNSA